MYYLLLMNHIFNTNFITYHNFISANCWHLKYYNEILSPNLRT